MNSTAVAPDLVKWLDCWYVFTAVNAKIIVAWNVVSCSLVCRYQSFGGAYCLHLQVRRVQMEAACSTATSVRSYQTTCNHIPEAPNLSLHMLLAIFIDGFSLTDICTCILINNYRIILLLGWLIAFWNHQKYYFCRKTLQCWQIYVICWFLSSAPCRN
jgi:hypothetical protein